ncbi:MAG: guanylate kinase [Bacillota bacterium]|jgi:guanylate kinase|nr:guanylate kinase [Eubacteriales bacterium]MDD3537244.1 guanylate kinase [Eubacteriales bacterium]MDI9491714.1 guanylate kinase [Bacillota bacterium]NLV69418.1 guanylate kinase [Clostridiales bacterium]
MEQGKLFVLSGPSGAGKGTICKEIVRREKIGLSVSMTTRAPRGEEKHGKSYYFVSEEEFQKNIDEGGFLEYAKIYGHSYGTPKKLVLGQLSKGKDIILEIEMQGAFQVKNVYPEGILIFVLPPSLAELRKRLIARGTEDEEDILIRQQATLNEIALIHDYDYYVINDELEQAVDKVRSIIKAEHSKVDKNVDRLIRKYEEEL